MFSTTHQRARTNRGVVNYIRLHSIILASCKPGCKPGFRQVRAGLRHAFDFFVKNLVANLLHQSRHVPHVRSSLGFKQVCSWLSTCFRHAFDLLVTCFRHAHASRKPGLQPGLQLARIMECGLYCQHIRSSRVDLFSRIAHL